jgi:hypothetical protein
MRQDIARTGQTLDERQRGFPVLLVDSGDEVFIKSIKAAMLSHAPNVPLIIKPLSESMDTPDAKAIILPASLALNPPEGLEKWLKDFSGEKIVVAEAVPGWILIALTPEQTAQSARQAAEGEVVRLARPSAVWSVVQIIAVIIVGVQLLFVLFAIGVSLLRL